MSLYVKCWALPNSIVQDYSEQYHTALAAVILTPGACGRVFRAAVDDIGSASSGRSNAFPESFLF